MLRMRLSPMCSVLLGSVYPKHSMPCSFRPFGLLCFSSASNADEQKSRAFAAAKTIEYLCNIQNYVPQQEAKGTQKFLSTLLVENLQRYPAEVSQDTIEEFRDLFDPRKGIELPDELKKQKRITKAQTMNNTGKKFSFFPNRLVVAHLFPLLSSFQDKTIVIGKAGISKTTAIILFAYLSGIVSQYQYERGQLQGITQIPKLFYLSYSTEIKSSKDLMYLIKKQCPYVEKEDQPTLSSFTRSFSDRQIETKVVIDQFNALVRQVEEFNCKPKDDTKWIKMINWKQLWEQPQQLGPYLYNSSINIEERILNQRTTTDEMGLDLNHHSKIDQFTVPYETEAQTEWGQKEILRFMVFEALKYAETQLTDRIFCSSQSKCEEVELINGLWDSLKSEGIEVLTHLTTREHFASKQNQIKGLKNIEELKVWLIGSAEALRAEQIKQLTELVKNFAKSHDQIMQLKKLWVVSSFLRKVKDLISSDESLNGAVSVPISELEIDSHWLQEIASDVGNHIDKNLFSYDATRKSLTLKVSVETFNQVVSDLPQRFKNLIIKLFKSILSFAHIQGSLCGLMYEDILTSILKDTNNQPVLTIEPRPNSLVPQNLQILRPLFYRGFYQLNIKKSFPDQQQKFKMKNVLESALRKQVFADPRQKNGKRSPISQSIDFIIAKPSSDGQSVQITSFDVACGKTIYQAKNKANKGLKAITAFLARNACESRNGGTLSSGVNLRKGEKIKHITLPIHSWTHHILCLNYSDKELDYQATLQPKDKEQEQSNEPLPDKTPIILKGGKTLRVQLTAVSQIELNSNNAKEMAIFERLHQTVQNILKKQKQENEKEPQ